MGRASQPLTREAINYTWRQLARRVGVAYESDEASVNGFEKMGTNVHYGKPEHRTRDSPDVIVVPTDAESWHKLLKLPPHSLAWVPVERMLPRGGSCSVRGELPVLFWSDRYPDTDGPIAHRQGDESVVFYVDIIATTFFMLSRWEETVVPTRDEHGRFPATASVAYKQGFLDRPIVDEYAMILRAWLKVLYPNWETKTGRPTFQLTHDIDRIFRFPNWRKGLRTLAGDLIKRRSLDLAKQSSVDTLTRLVNPRWDRYYTGIQKLARISGDYSLNNDSFYFMAADTGPFDRGYDSALIKDSVENLVSEGFEIGLHPSYEAFDDYTRLSEEKHRMDRILGMSKYGARQHYLRFRVPETWRQFEQVGLTHDATMTYAEQPGFRCGSCYAYYPFDIEMNCQINILEYPLVVMDGALKSSQTITPEQGEAQILQLAQCCKSVQGTFTLLWHNTSLDGSWQQWAEMYNRVVYKLVRMFHRSFK
jgi:hypothetical protein